MESITVSAILLLLPSYQSATTLHSQLQYLQYNVTKQAGQVHEVNGLRDIPDLNNIRHKDNESFDLCRRGETVPVYVYNRLALLPCKFMANSVNSNDSDLIISLYKGTPNTTLTLVESTDAFILNYTRASGFLVNVTKLDPTNNKYTCSIGYPNLDLRNYLILELMKENEDALLDISCENCTCLHYEPGAIGYYTCHVSQSIIPEKVHWFFKTTEGEYWKMSRSPEETFYKNGIVNYRKEILLPNIAVSGVVCKAKTINGNELEAFAPVLSRTKKPVKPEIVDKHLNTVVEDKPGVELTCSFLSDSDANVEWFQDGIPWEPTNWFENQKSNPKFQTVTRIPHTYNFTNYTCKISNEAGFDTKSFILQRKSSQALPASLTTDWTKVGLVYALIPLIISVLFASPFAICFWLNYQRRKAVMKRLDEGDPVASSQLNIDYDLCQQIKGGQFGEVYKTTMKDGNGEKREIVLKTFKWQPYLNETQATLVFMDLIEEIRIMQLLFSKVDRQPENIVRYMGYGAPSIQKFKVYLALDFCWPGQLASFLMERATQENQFFYDCEDGAFLYTEREEHMSEFAGPIVSTSNLMKWTEQIASAGVYMSSKQIVHRDLAARNMLLKCHASGDTVDEYVVQIADFGMARVVNENAYIITVEGEDNRSEEKPRFIPARWWPPEALSRNCSTYTLKSDVWSYGVLLWEMFNLCSKRPYSERNELPNPEKDDHQLPINLMTYLQNPVNRLKCPMFLEDNSEIWALMQTCWKENQDDRPDFQQIYLSVQKINRSHGPFPVRNKYKPINVRIPSEEYVSPGYYRMHQVTGCTKFSNEPFSEVL